MGKMIRFLFVGFVFAERSEHDFGPQKMAEVERNELWNGEANIDDVKPMKVSIDYDENFEEGDLIRQIGRTFIDYADENTEKLQNSDTGFLDPVNDDIELPQFLDFSDDQLNIGSHLESIIKSEAKKEVKLQGKIENSAQGKLLAGITERRESQNIEKPKTGPVRPKG